MLLKQERPEMDHYEEVDLTDALKKTSKNIFSYSLILEHSKI